MKSSFCFLLLILFGSQLAQAQIFEEDSTVKTIAYWDLGESYTYKIVLENYNVVGQDTLERISTRYDVDMVILDSTETSYDVRWTYRNMSYEMDEEDTILKGLMPKLMELTGGSAVEFRTNEYGAFQEVTNWEQIRDYYLAARDSMKVYFGNNPSVNEFLENMMSIYLSRSSIETTSIKDIHQFLNFHGGVYRLKEPLHGNMQFPSVVGQGKVDALVTVELLEIFPEDDDYTIYSIIEASPIQLRQQTELVLKKLMPTASDPEIKELMDQVGELWNVIENTSVIHHWGWPTFSLETRQTGSDQSIKVETRTIEII